MADRQPLEELVQQMLDAGEPDETIRRAVEVYQDRVATVPEQTLNEFKGVVEGLIPGAWGALRGLVYDQPKGIIEDTLSVIRGETPENAKRMIDSIAAMPAEFKEATHEERGQMLGNLVGGALAGRFAPLTPPPIARGTGKMLQMVGTKGGWPIRMMGAHQLGSGNPLGAAMIAVPEAMKTAGAALERWGSGVSAESGLIEAEALAQKASLQKARIGLTEIDKAIAQAKKEASATRAASARTEAKARTAEERADLAQLRTKSLLVGTAGEPDEFDLAARQLGRPQIAAQLRERAAQGRQPDVPASISELKTPNAMAIPTGGLRLGSAQPAPVATAAPAPVSRPSVVPPAPRAWTPETAAEFEQTRQMGVPIARRPPTLVLSPKEAAQEEQLMRAYRPSARLEGMKAAARVGRKPALSALEKELLQEQARERGIVLPDEE